MGKATVLSSLGNGKYKIRIEYDTRRIDAAIERLNARISALSGDETATGKLQRVSLKKRLEMLNALEGAYETVAWCADLTESLSGEIGTAEIARDPDTGILILPGYGDNSPSAYNRDRDGAMQNPLGNTAFQSYLNLCLFPAAQKYAPRYRIGEISAMTGSSCDIQINPISSRVRSIGITPVVTLESVPISYMDCDGTAFSVGDRVLVKFRGAGWGDPQVIGFESNPKSCGGPCYIVGEVTEIEGDYNDPAIRIYIKDTERDLTGIRCVPSDWVQWAVGDPVVAMNWQNCLAEPQCIDREQLAHAGTLFDMINQLREDVGVRPLMMNRRLMEAAKVQAEWHETVREMYSDHHGEGGNFPQDRAFDAEYSDYSDLTCWIGENAGFHQTPEEQFWGWYNSLGHYANMVRPEFEEMGLWRVGPLAAGEFYFEPETWNIQGGLYYIWVNVFGKLDPPHWRIEPLDVTFHNP